MFGFEVIPLLIAVWLVSEVKAAEDREKWDGAAVSDPDLFEYDLAVDDPNPWLQDPESTRWKWVMIDGLNQSAHWGVHDEDALDIRYWRRLYDV